MNSKLQTLRYSLCNHVAISAYLSPLLPRLNPSKTLHPLYTKGKFLLNAPRPQQHHFALTLHTLQSSHTESFRISRIAYTSSCNSVLEHIIPLLLLFTCVSGKFLHALQNPSQISYPEERQGYWVVSSRECFVVQFLIYTSVSFTRLPYI